MFNKISNISTTAEKSLQSSIPATKREEEEEEEEVELEATGNLPRLSLKDVLNWYEQDLLYAQ